MGGIPTAYAQTDPAAPLVRSAYATNGAVRADVLAGQAAGALRPSAYDVGKTNLSLLYGQYNSFYLDNNLTLTQTFSLPGLYNRLARVYGQDAVLAQTRLRQTRAELRAAVRTRVQQLAYKRTRRAILRRQDSTLAKLERGSALRLKTGEAGSLELASARAARLSVEAALAGLEADIASISLELAAATGAPADSLGAAADTLSPLVFSADTGAWQAAPALALARGNAERASLIAKAEGARLYPDITVGGFSQTLQGTYLRNGQERFYGAGTRFYGVQGGLSWGLYAKPALARRAAARLVAEAGASQAAAQARAIRANYQSLLRQYGKAQAGLAFYQNTALPQARLLARQAQLAFAAGATGYFGLAQSLQQAFSLELAWLDQLLAYNQAIIDLEAAAGVE